MRVHIDHRRDVMLDPFVFFRLHACSADAERTPPRYIQREATSSMKGAHVNRSLSTLVFALLFLPLVACTHSAANVAKDPCSLLTTAEVGAAVGKSLAGAAATDARHCYYSPDAVGSGQLIVEANWTDADVQFAGGQMANSILGATEKAPKVGDASYSTAMGNVFYARKGAAYVGIDMRAAAVEVRVIGPKLAAMALARM